MVLLCSIASRRSRSAPPRTSESPCSSRHQSPGGTPSKTCSTSPKAWVDTRNLQSVIDEPFELTIYDVDDVERMQRRRKEEAEVSTTASWFSLNMLVCNIFYFQ